MLRSQVQSKVEKPPYSGGNISVDSAPPFLPLEESNMNIMTKEKASSEKNAFYKYENRRKKYRRKKNHRRKKSGQ